LGVVVGVGGAVHLRLQHFGNRGKRPDPDKSKENLAAEYILRNPLAIYYILRYIYCILQWTGGLNGARSSKTNYETGRENPLFT
jgi:hypothetical protein